MQTQTLQEVSKNRRKTGTINSLPSKTNREKAEEVNINNIFKSFIINGVVPNKQRGEPINGADFSNMPSYRESLNAVIDAQQKFNDLPSKVRKHFNNDPNEFVEFVKDPKNGSELVKLGIATIRPENESKKFIKDLGKTIAKAVKPKEEKPPKTD